MPLFHYLFLQSTCASEQPQAAQQGRFSLAHEQLFVPQPFVHLQKTISLHAFGTDGRVVRTGFNVPSFSSQPEAVGDGTTGTETSAWLQMNA